MSYRDFSFEQIAETFAYDPEKGELWRRLKNGKMRKLVVAREAKHWAQKDAFVPTQVYFGGYRIIITHIIWMWMEGRWPVPGLLIDHIDRDVFNNKWENLREATRQQNAMNMQERGRWSREDDELPRHVYRKGRRFRVEVNGIEFGTFATIEEAEACAKEARAELQGEWSYEA